MSALQSETIEVVDTGERGIFVILFALVLVIMCFFVAMMIDQNRVASANRQKSQTAESVALAAVEAYLRPLQPCPSAVGDPDNCRTPSITDSAYITKMGALLDARLAAALARAREITGTNFVTSQGGRQHAAGTEISEDPNSLATRSGLLEVGLWFSERPAECTTNTGCPCGLPTAANAATLTTRQGCFLRCRDSGGGNDQCRDPIRGGDPEDLVEANAVRVTLQTQPDEGIGQFFSKIFNFQRINTRGRVAVAWMKQQHFAIALDLSRSTTVESHLYFGRRNDPTIIPPSSGPSGSKLLGDMSAVKALEPSYRCLAGCSGGACTASAGITNAVQNHYYTEFRSLDQAGDPRPELPFSQSLGRLDADVLNRDGPSRVILAEEPVGDCPNAMNASERLYRCRPLQKSYDEADAATKGRFVCAGAFVGTDTSRNYGTYIVHEDTRTPPDQQSPQPLFNLLRATNDILVFLGNRNAAGSRVGLFGFDREVIRETFTAGTDTGRRYFNLVDPLPSVREDFDQLLSLTDIESGWTARRINMFFPRGEKFNDIPNALREARQMLETHPSFRYADNQIVLISSGLSSCQRYDWRGLPASVPPDDQRPVCSTDYTESIRSLEEALLCDAQGNCVDIDPPPPSLNARGIRLHVVLGGDYVLPHSVLVKIAPPTLCSTTTRCMNEVELREQRYPNALWGYPDLTREQRFIDNSSAYGAIGSGWTQLYKPILWRNSLATKRSELEKYDRFFDDLNPAVQHSPFFYEPAYYLASTAAATQGMWIPLRPPVNTEYKTCAMTQCTTMDLDNVCAESPNPETPLADPLNAYTEIARSVDYEHRFLDPQGRVLCDTQCRPMFSQAGPPRMVGQVEAALREHLDTPLYSFVVEED